MDNKYTVPLAIIFGGIIVATAIYFSIPESAKKGVGDPSLVRPVTIADHIFGNPAASVMIITYSDFDCTYCKNFHNILHQIIANTGVKGNVAWVFRHFPLSEIHPNSRSHARASECVAKTSGNEAFWKFSDALFENQPIDPSQYGKIASSVGISGDAFATCFSNIPADIDARITEDRQNALDVGATGTPYSIILVNGMYPVVVDGAYSYDAIKTLVDEALIKTNN